MWVSGWPAIHINPRAPCCYDKSVKAGFFIAVLAASAALAQERATDETATGAEGGRETALQADAETAETASPAGAGAGETATRPATREAPVAPAGPNEAPTAFDPTEEVSEDYSIEFPVDI